MIKAEEIRKEYPVAYERLKEWAKTRLTFLRSILMQDGIEPNTIDEFPIINDEVMGALLMMNPRVLFDFLDYEQLPISVYYTERGFTGVIGEVSEEDISGGHDEFSTREGAENDIFIKGLKLVNNDIRTKA